MSPKGSGVMRGKERERRRQGGPKATIRDIDNRKKYTRHVGEGRITSSDSAANGEGSGRINLDETPESSHLHQPSTDICGPSIPKPRVVHSIQISIPQKGAESVDVVANDHPSAAVLPHKIDKEISREEGQQLDLKIGDGRADINDSIRRSNSGGVSNKNREYKPVSEASSGWFWGASGHDRDQSSVADIADILPGQGLMGAFWRGGVSVGPPPPAPVGGRSVSPRREEHGEADSRHNFCQEGPGPRSPSVCVDTSGGGGDDTGNHQYQWSVCRSVSTGSGTDTASLGIASAKAAVRSAGNRASELLRLMDDDNSISESECLKKADSAIRAAQTAVRCSNERLFELELMVGDTTAPSHAVGLGEDGGINPQSGVDSGSKGISSNSTLRQEDGRDVSPSPSLHSQIVQLAKQLGIAQDLQATSLAAMAKLRKRFAQNDAAATLLQAHLRGHSVRRSCRLGTTAAVTRKETRESPQAMELQADKQGGDGVAKLHLPRGGNLTVSRPLNSSCQGEDRNHISYVSKSERNASERNGEVQVNENDSQGNAATGSPAGTDDKRTEPRDEGTYASKAQVSVQPREAQGWWMLAEAEGEENVGHCELPVLRAVVKLQAVVRSIRARSIHFAAVNARFVEYFDQQYQVPYYVCSETNCSQWNRPFGFANSAFSPLHDCAHPSLENRAAEANEAPRRGEDGGVDSESNRNPDERTNFRGETLTSSLPQKSGQEAAALDIQCAVRACRARRRLAERIISAGL